jgi:tetratricopeptide (TPR) repeat protein
MAEGSMKAKIDFVIRTQRVYRWLLAPAAVLTLLAAVAFAQSQTAAPTTPKPPPKPEDELLSKMQAARNDPAQYVELLVRLVKEYPEARYAESAGFSFSSMLKKQAQRGNDPAILRGLAGKFIAGTASAPAALRVRINSTALRAMLDNNLAEQAVILARQTVAVLNEQEYITFIRKGYERDIANVLKTNPNYKPRPFLENEYTERFRQESAAYYSLLGRAYLKLNDPTQAEAAFKRANEISPDAAAATGLATILEKRGKDAEALEYMTQGMLTGKLDKAGIEQFQALYRRTHGGKLDGVEEYLDAHYRKTYRNPLKGEKHASAHAGSGRAVLAEFFTGAGCIPCIPFDYSFDAALEDYSRKDLVLLVYHWHAPTLDPMGNRSSDARVVYYGVQGAPTVFLDGQKFKIEGGADDARVKSEAEKKAPIIYSAVTSVINRELETLSPARLKLDAVRAGNGVKATATVEGLKEGAPDATLHFALVEEEVHYSGENGLRFHPMVVRNLAKEAGAKDYGFKVAPGQANKFEHVFDLDSITAQNLRYYDEWPAERNKEVNARIGGDADFDVGKFKEQKHLINPNHLSVVAFLQDNQTKAVLQAVYLKVPAADQGGQ